MVGSANHTAVCLLLRRGRFAGDGGHCRVLQALERILWTGLLSCRHHSTSLRTHCMAGGGRWQPKRGQHGLSSWCMCVPPGGDHPAGCVHCTSHWTETLLPVELLPCCLATPRHTPTQGFSEPARKAHPGVPAAAGLRPPLPCWAARTGRPPCRRRRDDVCCPGPCDIRPRSRRQCNVRCCRNCSQPDRSDDVGVASWHVATAG